MVEDGGHVTTTPGQSQLSPHTSLNMSLVNGYRVKCQNYRRMADREKEMRRREEKLGRSDMEEEEEVVVVVMVVVV